MKIRVIKLGGSLLTVPDLEERIQRVLAELPPALNLIIIGGGQLVESVRALDAIHHLDSQFVHWYCVDLLDYTALWLHQLCPQLKLIKTSQELDQLLCKARGHTCPATDDHREGEDASLSKERSADKQEKHASPATTQAGIPLPLSVIVQVGSFYAPRFQIPYQQQGEDLTSNEPSENQFQEIVSTTDRRRALAMPPANSRNASRNSTTTEAHIPAWIQNPQIMALLPASWHTTTDAIAGWLSIAVEASELLLLKSTDLPYSLEDLDRLAAEGLIDSVLPRLKSYLPTLTWINCRNLN